MSQWINTYVSVPTKNQWDLVSAEKPRHSLQVTGHGPVPEKRHQGCQAGLQEQRRGPSDKQEPAAGVAGTTANHQLQKQYTCAFLSWCCIGRGIISLFTLGKKTQTDTLPSLTSSSKVLSNVGHSTSSLLHWGQQSWNVLKDLLPSTSKAVFLPLLTLTSLLIEQIDAQKMPSLQLSTWCWAIWNTPGPTVYWL